MIASQSIVLNACVYLSGILLTLNPNRHTDRLLSAQSARVFYTQDYLKAAVGYIEEQATPKGVSGIEAIWVASDDPAIVDEVRSLAPAYFPNVEEEAIVYVADGVAGGSNTTGVDTHTRTQVCTAMQ